MNVKLDREAVRNVFETAESQAEAIVELYKMVFPDWDAIEKVHGWPTCNKFTSQEIGRLFMEFDRKHHPEVLQGGLWLNSGFSTLEGEHLPDWEIVRCDVTMK